MMLHSDDGAELMTDTISTNERPWSQGTTSAGSRARQQAGLAGAVELGHDVRPVQHEQARAGVGGCRARQARLARAGWAPQQHAARGPHAEARKQLRRLRACVRAWASAAEQGMMASERSCARAERSVNRGAVSNTSSVKASRHLTWLVRLPDSGDRSLANCTVLASVRPHSPQRACLYAQGIWGLSRGCITGRSVIAFSGDRTRSGSATSSRSAAACAATPPRAPKPSHAAAAPASAARRAACAAGPSGPPPTTSAAASPAAAAAPAWRGAHRGGLRALRPRILGHRSQGCGPRGLPHLLPGERRGGALPRGVAAVAAPVLRAATALAGPAAGQADRGRVPDQRCCAPGRARARAGARARATIRRLLVSFHAGHDGQALAAEQRQQHRVARQQRAPARTRAGSGSAGCSGVACEACFGPVACTMQAITAHSACLTYRRRRAGPHLACMSRTSSGFNLSP